MNERWEVLVIGGGAAGLMAGLRAAERGKKTLVLEKNRKPGVKILMSGGTRCNITHATDNRGIVDAYGPPGRFLHSALASFSVDDTIQFFEGEGVATKVEEYGKIFPVSDRAVDVLSALVNRLHRSGATLCLNEAVTALESQDGVFRIATSKQILHADRVILTTGGQSYPGSGTTGDGYRFAERFGHRIVEPRPALVPLATTVTWLKELQGLTIPEVGLRIREAEREWAKKRGPLLFAHFGLTGPVALDVSRVVSSHPEPTMLSAEIDFLPHRTAEEIDAFLKKEALSSGKKLLAAIVAVLVPRRLADFFLTRLGEPLERKATGLTKETRSALVASIKCFRVPLTGTLGFRKAEVTAGGIALDEVDSKTMQSKRVPGLFLAGEVLDLDGPIGGYNFQAAWSTGWLAGSSV